MAFLGQTFDANELSQGNGGNYDPLPPGWYAAWKAADESREGTRASTPGEDFKSFGSFLGQGVRCLMTIAPLNKNVQSEQCSYILTTWTANKLPAAPRDTGAGE